MSIIFQEEEITFYSALTLTMTMIECESGKIKTYERGKIKNANIITIIRLFKLLCLVISQEHLRYFYLDWSVLKSISVKVLVHIGKTEYEYLIFRSTQFLKSTSQFKLNILLTTSQLSRVQNNYNNNVLTIQNILNIY